MATVCGASLALMDAGVPIKNPVAGIAMGLVMEDGQYKILSDIMGEEDHLGDMDFKVAGTKNGITALQMDIKVTSVTFDVMQQAMEQAREGRLFILEKMSESLSHPREELSPNAPKIISFRIPKDRIRDVIGSGGKVIRDIIDQTGAKIDISDVGDVTVAAQNSHDLDKAVKLISDIALDPEIGEIYDATVVTITDFGAFVRFYGAKEGLIHISEISDKRIEKVTDLLSEGDIIQVKFLGFDGKGRAKLKMKNKIHVNDESDNS